MTKEEQCVSRDLAQRLQELGVKQDSYFWWNKVWRNHKDPESGEWVLEDKTNANLISQAGDCAFGERVTFSAFTVAELGEMLPAEIERKEVGLFLEYSPSDWATKEREHRVFYSTQGVAHVAQTASTEADARAKCLIYLLENKLI